MGDAALEQVEPKPPLGLGTTWEGVAASALGATRLRITVTDLEDAERAELRVEIGCTQGSSVGFRTREPGAEEPDLGLLLRAEGSAAIGLVAELFRLLAKKVEGAVLLASVAHLDPAVAEPPTNPEPDPGAVAEMFAQAFHANAQQTPEGSDQ